jgi:N6-adenosine-specific RNA methylase IME4
MKTPVKRSAQSQYATLSLSEIKDLKVRELADPAGCLLALWVPSVMLEDGLAVMKSWGFKLKQTYVWVKVKKNSSRCEDPDDALAFGMGRLFRQTHEIALIGTSGKSIYPKLKSHSQRSVSHDVNVRHSVKPETLQDKLDVMFPDCKKLELFARRNRVDWTCLGDGVTGRDIRDSIDDVIKEIQVP